MSVGNVVSLYELLKDEKVYANKIDTIKRIRGDVEVPSIIEGLAPRKPALPMDGSMVLLTPEELLTIKIEVVSVNGRVVGYQRDFKLANARGVADSLLRGEQIPPVTLAVDGNGTLWAVDGQHRCGGAVIARMPIWATVQKLDKDARRSMFLSQRNARKIAPDILTLAGTDPIARYVQRAVVDSTHPWSPIVSASRTSKTKITPYAAYQLLLRYVYNVEGQAASYKRTMEQHWDEVLANELAPLIMCFGDKKSNPLAFKPVAIQAIGATAMWVFRRRAHVFPEDRERWMEHMPKFPFARAVHFTTQQDKTDGLVKHWNKNIGQARKVIR